MPDVVIGSLISSLATGVGALPILFLKNMTHKWRDILLALTAGIMVSAAMFNLIPEALAQSSIKTIAIGVLLGVFVLSSLEKAIPHIDLEHSKIGITIDGKAMLIIAAITLHNLPEGLSVGVSYAEENHSLGGLVALAIGLQNAPEGFLVALFLFHQRVSKWKAVVIATLTGSVEIVTAMIGYTLTQYVDGLVPYALSFAAGSMLFIVYKELIPESHGDGHERASTYSFIIGILIMIYLTTLFA